MADRPTDWQKGMKSPNPNGRPVGTKNKVMSDNELHKYVGKRTQAAFDTVFKIMQNSKNENAKLKAALVIISEDDKSRKRIFDKVQADRKDKISQGKFVPVDDAQAKTHHIPSKAPVIGLSRE